MTRFFPSHAAAKKRLKTFLITSSTAYASRRNRDPGPQGRPNVSMLSPYLRRRVLTEDTVVAATLAHHSLTKMEKFIQEVLWRTYWKGHLEQHPGIWLRYLASIGTKRDGLSASQSDMYERCLQGHTGMECMDAWSQELVSHGYLHNHARMSFASIWIHTLRLPWQLGAAFFYKHLLDGDPASNTLSWRWVAGLHTKGKAYLASSEKIAWASEGRFPSTPDLATRPARVAESRASRETSMGLGWANACLLHDLDDSPKQLLLHAEDVSWLSDALASGVRPSKIACVDAQAFDDDRSQEVRDFDNALLKDACSVLCQDTEVTWIKRSGDLCDVTAAGTWCTPYACQGPVHATLNALPASQECRLQQIIRRWDRDVFPMASRGYFPFWKAARRHLVESDSSQHTLALG